jgi:hypothetical protein
MQREEAFKHNTGPLIAQMETFPKHSGHEKGTNRNIMAGAVQAQEPSHLERRSLTCRKHRYPPRTEGR